MNDMDHPPHHGGWKLATAFGLMFLVFALGLVIGGEWAHLSFSSFEVLPFAVLVVLVYLGGEHRWARVLSVLGGCAIILGIGLAAIVATFIVVLEPGSADPDTSLRFIDVIRLLLVCGGVTISPLIAAIGFIPGVRRALARILPLDPESFVHTVALVLVVALTLISFVPLLVLSEPPLLSLVNIMLAQGEDFTDGRGPNGILLDEFYGLIWLVPCTVLAVGYGIHRNLRDALSRLGLVRPKWQQVVLGFALAMALVLIVGVVSPGVDWLWGVMGWPKTDTKTFQQLLAGYFTPLGALVVGVVAGVGEEMAVRGVLQPRLGILLSNLFFTGVHAFQYNWDSLLLVFLLGLALGVIRLKTNTTTSAIVHGMYDFLIIMAVVYDIPGFFE